jgi:hypothetical protein
LGAVSQQEPPVLQQSLPPGVDWQELSAAEPMMQRDRIMDFISVFFFELINCHRVAAHRLESHREESIPQS